MSPGPVDALSSAPSFISSGTSGSLGTEPDHDHDDMLPPAQKNDKVTVKAEPTHAAIATPARAIKCEPRPACDSQLQAQDAQSPFHEDRMEVDVSLRPGQEQLASGVQAATATASKQNAVPVAHDHDQASTATASAQSEIPVAFHDQASTASVQNAIPVALHDHDQASTTATASPQNAIPVALHHDHDQASTASTASPQNAIPVALDHAAMAVHNIMVHMHTVADHAC